MLSMIEIRNKTKRICNKTFCVPVTHISICLGMMTWKDSEVVRSWHLGGESPLNSVTTNINQDKCVA